MSERRFYTPADLAAMGLPDMPATDRAIQLMADRGGWRRPDAEFPHHPNGFWRKRAGRGGGFEYTSDVLPMRPRLALIHREQRAATPTPTPRDALKDDLRISSMWTHYNGLSNRLKAKARAALEALAAAEDLAASGTDRTSAYMLAATGAGVSVRTLYNWRDQVGSTPRQHWLAALAPRYSGRKTEADCSPEALAFIKADYLRREKPNFSDCYRRLARAAAEHEWTIPSERTLQRRIEKLSEAQKVLARDGAEALARLYPAQERDKSTLHALECVNADGHKFDVFVAWPGEKTPVRPMLVAFQDVHSGMIVSWRLDRAETAHAVLLAFGDLVETWGIPEQAVLDNGRSFASKWLSGGVGNRYRFKVKADEPDGVMTTMGVQIHWATPYHGQSKPIERAFKDMAQSIAKDPRFAGAYTGNKVDAKPENYGSKAVPLDLFERVVAEGIAEHNTRVGRRSSICNGQSFEQVFLASYQASLIRRASVEQRQLWLLAAEGVSVRKQDGTIHLFGNRYWTDALTDLRSTKVVARFDPDALADGVHVYRLDGTYVAHAECIEAAGFLDVTAARTHAAARKAWLKAEKAKLEAELTMSLGRITSLMPSGPKPAEAPETKVVRPVFRRGGGGGSLAAAVAQQEEFERSQSETLAQLGRGLHALRLVQNDDDAAG